MSGKPELVTPPKGTAASGGADRLLFLMVALQEREHRALAEAMHDGPMQDITGVLLSLASVRRGLTGEAAARLAEIETRLRDAATALHRPPPPFRPGHSTRQMLELGLAQRVGGLLADHLHTTLDIEVAPPDVVETAVVLATVQLLLQESDPLDRVARTAVTIRSDERAVELLLQVAYEETPPGPDRAAGQPVPDRAAHRPAPDRTAGQATRDRAADRMARLRRLTEILDARLSADQVTNGWSVSLRLPRSRPRI